MFTSGSTIGTRPCSSTCLATSTCCATTARIPSRLASWITDRSFVPKTPIFRANMKYAIFNPTWTVPSTILKEDIIGHKEGPSAAIAEKHLHVYDRNGNEVDPSSVDWSGGGGGYTLRQDAGEKNALGRVKFMFPNPYDVYLHDTPHRELFAARFVTSYARSDEIALSETRLDAARNGASSAR